ncbi:hypothetical protein K491DRAFT_755119 [Lophiostoma macrostomum CBS 122681]|uniref:BTB domain-containing protein n=1 Tax=Lophiostoma macrostomum CBS 122681 TaxID=1314788 RepID=A0A6A6TLI4_9PLEO|nr:hypothetical protein K491DRAFT_755119 [Lophiostoma macrostomum CBS 122681]
MERLHKNGILDLGTKVITVRVGQEPSHTDFTVHESLIRKSSPFFEAALSRQWREATERLVKLPEADAQAFKLYVHWLYTGHPNIFITGNPHSSDRTQLVKDREIELTKLVQGYLLGDYPQDCDYKDTLADAFLEWGSRFWSGLAQPFKHAAPIYSSTTKGSPVRELIVDFTLWTQRHTCWDGVGDDELPNAFLCDYIRAREAKDRDVAARNSSPFFRFKGTCHYHCHSDDTCYREDIDSDDDIPHFDSLFPEGISDDK